MVTLLGHPPLGDQIILSGAVVELLDRHGEIGVYCWPEYEESVKSFYHHFYPKVSIFTRLRAAGPTLLCGYHNQNGALEGEGFAQWFYRQLDIPYSARWDSCPLRLAASKYEQKIRPPVGDYCFIHDDPARDLVIDRQRLPQMTFYSPPDASGSILKYADVLEQAAEVHVIHSAFYWLAESLQPRGRLFLHRYARPQSWYGDPPQHEWIVLD